MKFCHVLTLSLILCLECSAGIDRHYKRLETKAESSKLRNIDFIYLINLDQRPERFESCMAQLSPYGIFPLRFSAIYGWSLPASALNEIGLKFLPGMWMGYDTVMHFPPEGGCRYFYLNDTCYHHTFFSGWTTPGAIGCTLSHLSVLQDAYDAGYGTIWVLEDDFKVVQDPHMLSERIDELDAMVGKDWDILYTDFDYLMGIDENRSILEQLPMKWRPDMPAFDLKSLLEHTDVGPNFMKIGTRHRTHSMIIRRCGMQKILDFYKEHNMFIPYDHELSFIPGIKLYVLKNPIVTANETSSDTKNHVFH
jgi:GR25 family glycosyltransferase involved in LPS biosynthesis